MSTGFAAGEPGEREFAGAVLLAPDVSPPAGAVAAHAAALERLTDRPSAAVVVPIYLGGPSLDACLSSLRAHAPEAQVILVDDSRGHPDVGALCDRYLEVLPWATLVVNEHNLGFVGSANAGMRAAERGRDLVLLNSDTVVTRGWLDKLSVAAYVSRDIATVSPLSNAADVFSLPRDRVDNPLPPGWEPDLCNRVLEEVAPRMYEAVPVTSGFCQYIRRAALDELGMFDEYLFHRGYGEDNDFCARATEAGFEHVIDDGTFIFHERTSSFQGSKAHLSRLNKAVLKALHPLHVQLSLDWEARSRLDDVRRAYATAVEALVSMSAEQVRATLGNGGTTLTIVANGEVLAAPDEPEGRRVALALGPSHADVTVFGAARCRVEAPYSPLGLASWLTNRWRVTRLEVAPGALDPGEEARLRAAWQL